ncbi:amino acid ABC transporter, permease protein [Campylobacter showae]|jgi:amino ABC transporter, permease protein, 3-TM region, his/glu/gln/arg/opine family|uniref:Amino acid ABC transporter permease n=4 Tax=Campylobacter TaxID=194 RepID=A0A842J711_9BACT|nr:MULTISPECIES: amino acid ABC transporter permease [Campylobacter]EET79701.1 ABC transporter, permease protein [Campylobacter showae RM3277]EKU11964.1 Putative amino acid ABC tansporter permease protein [Campylobacter showae CSUNSWCD]MBC2881932.1 amino acid ABC transporter permease [Campylobacter massiliensis]QCD48562.1 amino acid ABC transporter, permease protein [Campylobacter showae]
MLNEKFFRALFFVVIVSAGVYYFYPTELNEAQRLAYLKSYGVTLGLTIGGTAIGVTLGFILAFLKFLNIKILSFLIDEYVDILRGTPIILQLLIFSVVIFATWSDNFYVALIALGLNSSAYVAEIVRSGINSVDKGQMEAARAMGLNYYVSMREVVFPQATKNILPALANEFISLFKETSVVGYISVIDITMQSKSLQAVFYSPEPVIFTGIVYYVSVKFFTFLVKILERRLNRHD